MLPPPDALSGLRSVSVLRCSLRERLPRAPCPAVPGLGTGGSVLQLSPPGSGGSGRAPARRAVPGVGCAGIWLNPGALAAQAGAQARVWFSKI